MSQSRLSRKKERELIQLRSELLRLKYQAESLQQQAQQTRERERQNHFAQIMELAENLPLGGLAWKAVMLPNKWKHKLLVAVALILMQWFGKRHRH